MTTDVKLLPCPFCGKDEHLQVEHLEGTVVHPAYRVRCDWCGASTGYTDKDCRANWNKRANMEPLIAENERLRAKYQRAAESSEHFAARAERLAEAVRGLKDLMLERVKWEPCDCGCPQQRTPDGPHSVTWLRAAQKVEIAISKAEDRG